MTDNDAVADAFENFFHDLVMNNLDKIVQDKYVWGPKYWRQFGLDVKNSKIVFHVVYFKIIKKEPAYAQLYSII
jgi:hypothetical protein